MNKTSDRMHQAIAMIRAGEKVTAAARFCKISHVAVYVSPLYAAYCVERAAAGNPVRRAKHRKRPLPE